jgi:V8-like Glu-specific endopeptidase
MKSFARRPVRATHLVLPLALLAACTQPVGETQAQDDSAIVGGKKVSSSDPVAKVAVAIVDADVGEYCTGIVLDSHHVVTASHCFDDTSRTPNIRVGPGDTAALLPVSAVAVHAKSNKAKRDAYDAVIADATSAGDIALPSGPLYDVAVLETVNALPSTVKAASFVGPDALDGATLGSAGYGCTSTACKSAVDTLHSVAMHYANESDTANVVVLSSGGKKGTCAGDSGGPDYVVTASGAIEVFGIVMTGPTRCEAGISVDTLVAPYLDWITSTAQTMGSGGSTSTYKLTRY